MIRSLNLCFWKVKINYNIFVGENCFKLVKKYVKGILLVTDEEIKRYEFQLLYRKWVHNSWKTWSKLTMKKQP